MCMCVCRTVCKGVYLRMFARVSQYVSIYALRVQEKGEGEKRKRARDSNEAQNRAGHNTAKKRQGTSQTEHGLRTGERERE